MGKKNRINFFSILFFLVVIISSIYFVIAAHVATFSSGATTHTILEDVQSLVNITINNTDTTYSGNITQVNVTIPSGVVFNGTTNGTTVSVHNFTNTSTVLTWNNTNSLVNNLTLQQFWFNVTVATPGNYTLTILTANSSNTTTKSLTLTANDTTSPASIDFVSPTETNNSNLSRSFILVNITATDNGVIDTILARLHNSTHQVTNTTTSSTSPLNVNISGLSDGRYYINATINDTAGNSNNSVTRNITLDATVPFINFGASGNDDNNSEVIRTTLSVNFTVTETNERNISFYLYNSSALVNATNFTDGTRIINYTGLVVGSYYYNATVRDFADNSNTTQTRKIALYAADPSPSSSSSGGGGGGSTTTFWSKGTFSVNDEQLEEGYTKDIIAKQRLQIKINNEDHYVGVKEVTSSTAKIEVTSTPVEKILSIGERWKVEVTGDNYYDLIVTLNSIQGTIANLNILSVNEEIPKASPPPQEETTQEEQPTITGEATEGTAEEGGNLLWLWIIIALVVIFVVWFIIHKKHKG